MMSARRLQLTDLVSMGQVSMVILCCHGCASHFCMELLSTSSKKRFSSYQKFSDPTCFSMILFSIKLEWNIDLSLLCARPGIEPAFLFSHHEASIRAVSSDVKLHQISKSITFIRLLSTWPAERTSFSITLLPIYCQATFWTLPAAQNFGTPRMHKWRNTAHFHLPTSPRSSTFPRIQSRNLLHF